MWSHINSIIRNKDCSCKFINIANTCIDLGHWPSHFKTSTMVVIVNKGKKISIPKPNKATFNSPKSYHLIVLLNTIRKLFKKWLENVFNSIWFPTTLFILVNSKVSNKDLPQMWRLHLLTSFDQGGLKISLQVPWHLTSLNSFLS